MKLTSFSFSEHENSNRFWELKEANFGKINLIVGKNASGKSRTLNVIHGLSRLLNGSKKSLFETGSFKTVFETDQGKKYSYDLTLKDFEVHSELFKVSRTTVLKREADGKGTLNADQLKQTMAIQSPKDEIVALTRRDRIQHPYLDELHKWATAVQLYKFGTPLGQDVVYMFEGGPSEQDQSGDPSAVVSTYKNGIEEFGEEFSNKIVQDLNSIGYNCESAGLITDEKINIKGIPAAILYVKEKDLDTETKQLEMSRGMFRAFSIIIQMNYSIKSGKHSCILIDDIGEGLDYERSSKLIELLIDMVNENNFQLIMTSNDRFVMNHVPLEYWSVMIREGHEVRFVNNLNAREKFEEFELMGLSNFDFFASKMYLDEESG